MRSSTTGRRLKRVGGHARLAGAWACVAALACACAPAAVAPKSAPEPPALAAPAPQTPAQQPAQVVLESEGMSADHSHCTAPNLGGMFKQSEQALSSGEDSFSTVAPATVLVTTPFGHGTGVIVDAAGWVLTNDHVVSSGENADFEVEAYITTVDIADTGVVQPGKRYRTVAYKVDSDRDLALLKIVDPAARGVTFPAVSLARGNPKPGRKVFAIGNAGVGFGWAIKECSINAVGTVENNSAAIAHLQSSTGTGEQRAELQKQLSQAAARTGLQIQTDCTILPGDSGGPLVDGATNELVGLNVLIRPEVAQQQIIGTVAVHIHIQEIKSFLEKIPSSPAQTVPDPWALDGAALGTADVDGDGEIDLLRVRGRCPGGMSCAALFGDLDQNSFQGARTLPPLEQIIAERRFDPEFILMKRARMPRNPDRPRFPVADTLFFYDSSNTGMLDRILVLDAEEGTIRGFRFVNGAVKHDITLDGVHVSPERFEDAQLARQFSRFSGLMDDSAALGRRFAERTQALASSVKDLTKDGVSETVFLETRLDQRVVVDADQDSLSAFKTEQDLHSALANGTADVEFLAVLGTPTRVFYDTDNDKKFDLELVAPDLAHGFAVFAQRYTPDGNAFPAPEHVGRRVLRPALLGAGNSGQHLEQVFAEAASAGFADLEDGAASFPSTQPSPNFTVHRVDGQQHVLRVQDGEKLLVLVDLDQRAKIAPGAERELIQSSKFDPEFVFVGMKGLTFAFYDTDDDARFDLVLVSSEGDPATATASFTLPAKGAAHYRPEPAGNMFDASHFKNWRHKNEFKKVTSLLLAKRN